jgi:2-hydroxychromene-2-carboxylate isomerase
LTRALQQAFWLHGADIGLPAERKRIADACGFDGARLLAREQDADVKEKWDLDRAHAVQSGVFGFPTFGFDGEIYWGQDSLPFLQRHLEGSPL